MMNNNRTWKQMVARFLLKVALAVLVYVGIVFWAEQEGLNWFKLLATVIFYLVTLWLVQDYFNKVNYLCPNCHLTFEPLLKEVFWALHTSKTRRLTCPHCGKQSFCLEVMKEE